jgi:hypothetical protein
MKRLLWALAFALLTFGVQAQQGFKIGLHGGIPIQGEVNEVVSLVAGADLGYLFALGEVVDAGIMTGFINGFPEKFDAGGADLPHVQFAPVAGSFRIWPSNSFSFGADVGYALGLNAGNDGGLYYRPVLGYLMGPRTEVNLSYTGIDTPGQPWATVTLGVLYTFTKNLRR